MPKLTWMEKLDEGVPTLKDLLVEVGLHPRRGQLVKLRPLKGEKVFRLPAKDEVARIYICRSFP